MRRFAPLLLALALALPAAAVAGRAAPGDGSLAVADASGVLTVQVKGVIFGHFDRGKMTVVEWKPDNANANANALPTVSGAKIDVKGAKINVVYSGANVRFLFPSGKYTLKFDGTGIDLSAVGQGSLKATKSSLEQGTISVNGEKPIAIPSVATFGGSLAVTAVEKAGDKSTGAATPSSSNGRS
jgi:hypothetical protein